MKIMTNFSATQQIRIRADVDEVHLDSINGSNKITVSFHRHESTQQSVCMCSGDPVMSNEKSMEASQPDISTKG